jgi:hypothetical protein
MPDREQLEALTHAVRALTDQSMPTIEQILGNFIEQIDQLTKAVEAERTALLGLTAAVSEIGRHLGLDEGFAGGETLH